MIREGEPDVTLKYLAQHPHRKLAINSFTEGTSLYIRDTVGPIKMEPIHLNIG